MSGAIVVECLDKANEMLQYMRIIREEDLCEIDKRGKRIKELEAENERLKARVKEREGIVNYAHQCITANKSMGHRIEKLRAALEKFVWSDRPDTVPETWQEKSAKQALEEDEKERK